MCKEKVAIFPGHVGKDSGAVDRLDDDRLYTIEAVVTACIASQLHMYLDCIGIDSDIYTGPFQDRIESSQGCTCGVSIHCDSFRDSHVSGAHLIHYTGSKRGKIISDCIYDALDVFMDVRGVTEREDLYILRNTSFPVALVECGYLTNPFDEAMLNDYSHQNKIAYAIGWGILKYIKMI